MSRKKRIFLYVASAILALWLIGPILWIVDASFQLDNELFSVPPHWIPQNPTLDNYKFIITRVPPPAYDYDPGIIRMGRHASGEALAAIPALKNSLVVSTATMALNVAISVLAAYAFSRLKFVGRDASFFFIMMSRLIPAIAIAIPFFVIIDRLHLLDTYLALILVYLAFTLPFTIWFMTKYFDFMPPDLEDAAMVDGCTRFQCLTKVVIPVVAPGIAATAAFAFMASYSEFLFAVLLTKTMASKTVPVVLSAAAINLDASYALASTTVVLAIIPPIIFALIFRNYITSGLSMAFGK
ncbi:MAG: carbohydrate ABC transporter permease [Anaerolineae bacterium]